jgi:RND family efflux transporter MFP subunit
MHEIPRYPGPALNDQLSSDLASLRISREEARPPSRWGRVIVVVVALGAVAAAGVAVYPAVEARIFKTEVDVAEIGLASPSQAAADLTSTGYVVPQVVVRVGPKVAGRVAAVHVTEGQAVKAGDVLFELDPADQKSALASAQARVGTARARAQAARARAVTARARAQSARANVAEIQSQYERQQKLAETGAAPQGSADDLQMRLKSLQTQVSSADADADAADAEATAADAEANAAQVEVNAFNVSLGNMTIVSPIDGRATTKPAQVGDVVVPSATLVELTDWSTLEVETDVPEARLHLAKVGAPAEVVLDAFPDQRFRGVVAEVSPKLNRSKATGTVKVKFVDLPEGVLPEMAARVSFLQKPLDAAAMAEKPRRVVPAAAVVDRGGVKQVWIVDGGKVHLTPVTVGGPFAGGLELIDGPPPGTRVVKDPPKELSDGSPIKEKNES